MTVYSDFAVSQKRKINEVDSMWTGDKEGKTRCWWV